MAYNGSNGTFSRLYDWTDDRDANIKIRADRMDAEMDGFATGLSTAICKDGQTTPTANLPMGTYKHTAVGDATAADQYAAAGQVQDGGFVWGGTSSGTDTVTLTLSPSLTAYAAGQSFRFIAGGTNTGAATINIDTVGAKAIQVNGSALAAGDITTGKIYQIDYDGTQFQLTKLSDHSISAASNGGASISSGVVSVDPNNATDATIAAGDEILFADADDSSAVKKDTVQGIIDLVSTPLPRGWIAGLTLSNNGTDGDHDIDISAGECRDSSNASDITLSAITKRIDATWSAGTGNGGLSSSLTAPANNTWYHVFAILVGGSADVGFDTSVTAANLVADHSATAYRRIGSIKTDGFANIVAFKQFGGIFRWSTVPTLDEDNASPGTTANTITLTCPTGVRVDARIRFYYAGTNSYIVSSLDVSDEAPTTSSSPLASNLNTAGSQADEESVLTNTSAQIRYRVGVDGQVRVATIGWTDHRGRWD